MTYLRHDASTGPCTQYGPGGHCNRLVSHVTHETRSSRGKVLGRWKVRLEIEQVSTDGVLEVSE